MTRPVAVFPDVVPQHLKVHPLRHECPEDVAMRRFAPGARELLRSQTKTATMAPLVFDLKSERGRDLVQFEPESLIEVAPRLDIQQPDVEIMPVGICVRAGILREMIKRPLGAVDVQQREHDHEWKINEDRDAVDQQPQRRDCYFGPFFQESFQIFILTLVAATPS